MALWLRYLIALVVGGHGFILIGPASPFRTFKEWRGSSWLLGSVVSGDQLKALVVALHLIAGIATLGCAVAVAFAPSLPGWWRPLAMGGAAVGITAFAAFWDGQTQLLFQEGAVGAVISLMLLVGAIAFPRAFR